MSTTGKHRLGQHPRAWSHERRVKKCGQGLLVWLILTVFASLGFSQKVKVGHDRSVDFSKYRTYTWAKPETPPTRPLLYEDVVGTIDGELKAKGFERIQKDGDITVVAAGGIAFGSNLGAGTPSLPTTGGPPPTMNAAMWSGADASSVLTSPAIAQGALVLEFVDRSQNQVIWSGSVSQTLDPEQKEKSFKLVEKAIVKLLKDFPPKDSAK
jgi:hypothetical protein